MAGLIRHPIVGERVKKGFPGQAWICPDLSRLKEWTPGSSEASIIVIRQHVFYPQMVQMNFHRFSQIFHRLTQMAVYSNTAHKCSNLRISQIPIENADWKCWHSSSAQARFVRTFIIGIQILCPQKIISGLSRFQIKKGPYQNGTGLQFTYLNHSKILNSWSRCILLNWLHTGL